jgi:hypothetical protein
MLRTAMTILMLIIPAAFLSEAIGSEVTMGVGLLLGIVLMSLLVGAVGIVVLAATVTPRNPRE